MSASLLRPVNLESAGLVQIERANVTFASLSPELVLVQITVENPDSSRSPATCAQLEAAPLGAFVPWRPLVTIPVPPVEPGESTVLRTIVRRAPLPPLGDPAQVSPAQFLSALLPEGSAPIPQARHAGGRHPPRAFLGKGMSDLPADPFALLGHANAHWAGNLNIFVGDRAVERHLAQALRIYPGRVNLAAFIVGSGADAYAFHLAGAGAAWDAALFDVSNRQSLTLDLQGISPLDERAWIEVRRHAVMLLALRPPEGCGQGAVEVHVEQQSSGQSAVVEFSLDPAAVGPGCFVVA